MDKRGDVAIVLFVILFVIACGLALFSLNSANSRLKNSFIGVGSIQNLVSALEQNDFENSVKGTDFETLRETLINVFAYVAITQDIVGKTCCNGSSCELIGILPEDLIKITEDVRVKDPSLIFSLILQESECDWRYEDRNKFGIMQVDLEYCGSYDLPLVLEECKNELLNTEKNIEVGSKILRKYFDEYNGGIVFDCFGDARVYSGWEAAVRAYDGLDCSDNLDENYVEEIFERYEELKKVSRILKEKEVEESVFMEDEGVDFSVEYKFSLDA